MYTHCDLACTPETIHWPRGHNLGLGLDHLALFNVTTLNYLSACYVNDHLTTL